MKNNTIFEIMDLTKESEKLLIDLEPKRIFKHFDDYPTDKRVLSLACMIHSGHKDKANIDYIVHLLDTANKALIYKDKNNIDVNDSIIVQASMLHDSMEDEEAIRNKREMNNINDAKDDEAIQKNLYYEYDINKRAQFAINSVTRKNETYGDFISRIKKDSQKDVLCSIVKISDINSNLEPKRLNKIDIKDSLKKRYKKAINELSGKSYKREIKHSI